MAFGRKPFVAGNWKMFKTVAEAAPPGLRAGAWPAGDQRCRESALPALYRLAGSERAAGRHRYRSGRPGYASGRLRALSPAGISPAMVAELCQLCHHRPFRAAQYFGETDETVNKKVKAALAHGLTPIVCRGRDPGRKPGWAHRRGVSIASFVKAWLGWRRHPGLPSGRSRW